MENSLKLRIKKRPSLSRSWLPKATLRPLQTGRHIRVVPLLRFGSASTRSGPRPASSLSISSKSTSTGGVRASSSTRRTAASRTRCSGSGSRRPRACVPEREEERARVAQEIEDDDGDAALFELGRDQSHRLIADRSDGEAERHRFIPMRLTTAMVDNEDTAHFEGELTEPLEDIWATRDLPRWNLLCQELKSPRWLPSLLIRSHR